MFRWISDNQELLWWLAVVSGVMFIGTLLLLPFLAARIPDDYFLHRKRRRGPWDNQSPVLRLVLVALKNLLGVVLVLVGVGMLFTPGQGVLTIFIGVLLLDFPGKFTLERWLISKRPVRRAVNWMRARSGRPPLRLARKNEDEI